MTTEKSISKHKTASTRSAGSAPSTAQAFDIIPPGKVRPSASSRPVIAPSGPAVADNTLKTDAGAPELHLTHTSPTLEPPKDTDKEPEPEQKGVLLSDLVAKREKAATEENTETEEDAGTVPAADTGDKADEPEPEAGKPVAESDEKPEEPDSKTSDEAEPAKEKATPAADKLSDEDSLSAVLTGTSDEDNEDGGDGTKEPSDSVKEAIKDLDEKDGRPHYELYGGKPVIVVHKHHGTSALVWILWFILCLAVALLIIDLLLDADLVTTDYVIPHTDFL